MAVEMLRGPDHIARRSERVFMNGGVVRPLGPEGKRGVGGSFGRRRTLRWRPPTGRRAPAADLFEASGLRFRSPYSMAGPGSWAVRIIRCMPLQPRHWNW